MNKKLKITPLFFVVFLLILSLIQNVHADALIDTEAGYYFVSAYNPSFIVVNHTTYLAYAYQTKLSGYYYKVNLKVWDTNGTLITYVTHEPDYSGIRQALFGVYGDVNKPIIWIMGIPYYRQHSSGAPYVVYKYNLTDDTLTLVYSRISGNEVSGTAYRMIGNPIWVGTHIYVAGFWYWKESSSDYSRQSLIIFSDDGVWTHTINGWHSDLENPYVIFGNYNPEHPDLLVFCVRWKKLVRVYTFKLSTSTIEKKSEGVPSDVKNRMTSKYNALIRASYIQTSYVNSRTSVSAKVPVYLESGISEVLWMRACETGYYTEKEHYVLSRALYPAHAIPDTDTTAFYWYDILNEKIYITETKQGTTYANIIELEVEPTIDTYIIGQAFYQILGDGHVKLYMYVIPTEPDTAEIPDYQKYETVPSIENPDYGEITISLIAGSLLVPFLMMFIPPMLLGQEVGMIGFIVGLVISTAIMYLAGILPLWVVFLIGLGLIAGLFFGKRGFGNE